MSLDEAPFGELLSEYIVECLPLAEQVGDTFVELERRWRAGESGDELLASVKGGLHTVKGNSALMGLTPMQDLAHALEDACAFLARMPAHQDDEAAALLVTGSGLLADLIRGASSETDPDAAAEFVARVRGFLAAGAHEQPGLSAERRRGERRSAARAPAIADAAGNVVRVDFRRLDALLEVLGEGLIQHSALAEVYRRLVRRVGACVELAELDQTVVSLEKTLKRLEATLMETRLLPVSTVFNRFPRMVRDVAHAEGKRARLLLGGGETRLDKAVLDRLSEPLLHLVSNAVVHGIERPDQRTGAGKPGEGLLRLEAASVSGRVVITLSDDGRGLDEAAIRARADELGLDGRTSDPADLHSLIFVPGLSTAEQLSTRAGRGVGLDVVAGSIHTLGGTIEVESQAGRGTAFRLSLPLTLAIVRSLIVEVDRERYAVPLTHVAETVQVEPQSIREINQRGVTQWRGGLIHVADGGAVLGTHPPARTPRRFYVVMTAGAKRRGLLVDRLVGHQDIVVKGLDPALGRPDVVSGTTILGDGRVACILDVVRILDGARRAS
ncbi:MAG TPA: chemotaxis protein CheW [Gemmatimonadales bacterium]|nr:chemotaxis protein CheW [Gemmatimonadales bacterium]